MLEQVIAMEDRKGRLDEDGLLKVPMTPKFLLHDVKEYLNCNTSSFKLLRCNVLLMRYFSLNFLFCRLIYVTLCIMSCC